MTIKARLAYSKNLFISFTPRGKRTDTYINGFARINGKTVSGILWDGGAEKIFYAYGIHARMASNLAHTNRREYRVNQFMFAQEAA